MSSYLATRVLVPSGVYSPGGAGNNFHPENNHIPRVLIRRVHEAAQSSAEEMVIWGSGNLLGLGAESYTGNTDPILSHVSVGSGTDISSRALAEVVARNTVFVDWITQGTTKPDGTMRKLMDVSRLTQMGWNSSIALEDGIKGTYKWYFALNTDELRQK